LTVICLGGEVITDKPPRRGRFKGLSTGDAPREIKLARTVSALSTLTFEPELALNRFQDLLRSIFRFDDNDLDFGDSRLD
jgi:hypothetical protein